MTEQKTEWSGRAYTWSLMTYASFEEIERLLNEAKHYAWCYHDKDENEDGTKVTPHTHIIIIFEQQKSLKWIQDKINSTQNTLGECRKKVGNDFVPLSIEGLYSYLLHIGYPDKYQYDLDERHIDNLEYWKRYDKEVITNVDQDFIADLLSTEFQRETDHKLFMAQKYGRDFIRNYDKYRSFRESMFIKELYEIGIDDFTLLIQYCHEEHITQREAIHFLKQRMKFERGWYDRNNNNNP